MCEEEPKKWYRFWQQGGPYLYQLTTEKNALEIADKQKLFCKEVGKSITLVLDHLSSGSVGDVTLKASES